MAAMLITPAATARLWTDRLSWMVIAAGLIGALSGAVGTVMSAFMTRMPTGPVIVLSAAALFLISLVFAPKKGILAKVLRRLSMRRSVARENALRTFYETAEKAESWEITVTAAELAQSRGTTESHITVALQHLHNEGLVEQQDSVYQLTEKGIQTAYQVVRNHRLWEMFLMHEQQLGADHVDRDADFIEHFLSPEIIQELESLLRVHGLDMKLPSSVHPLFNH